MVVVNNGTEACKKRGVFLDCVKSQGGDGTIEVIESAGCLAGLLGPKTIRYTLPIASIPGTDEMVMDLPPGSTIVNKVVVSEDGRIREFVLSRGGSIHIGSTGEVIQASNSKGQIDPGDPSIGYAAKRATAYTDQVIAQGKIISNEVIKE